MKHLSMIFSLVLFSTFAYGQAKVGVVDLQKAVQSTAEGKKSKGELEAEFEKKKKELQKREGDLKKMGEDIEKKKGVMAEDALQRKQAEFQEEMMKYREQMEKSRMDLQKKDRELTEPILNKMRKVVDRIAKEKGYGLIIEATPMVLYVTKENDLTDDVIKAFEKEK